MFAICGGQKLTVAYRFFTIFSVFGRTELVSCKLQVYLRMLNHVLTGKCHINFTVDKSIRDEIAL